MNTYTHGCREEELVFISLSFKAFVTGPCPRGFAIPLVPHQSLRLFYGWLFISEKMKDLFVLMETLVFYFGLSHISLILLDRTNDSPV